MGRTHHAGMLVLSLVSILAFAAAANDVNTGGQRGVIRALSAQTLGKTGVNIGGALRYSQDWEYVAGPLGTGPVVATDGTIINDRESPQLFSGDFFLGYGITEALDFSLAMPLYYDRTGWGPSRSGIGDLEMALKLAYPWQKDYAWFTHAWYGKIILPTGTSKRGYFPRHSYYIHDGESDEDLFSSGAIFFNPMLIWSLHFDRINAKIPLTLNANFGGIIADKKSGSAVVAAISLELHPVTWMSAFVEVSGESRVKWYTEYFRISAFNNDPFWITPGIRLNFPKGFYLIGAGDFAWTDKQSKNAATWNRKGYRYSTRSLPRYGAQLTLGWNGVIVERDRDKDGVIDKKDFCIDVAEDLDGVDDLDGCPDPDNDNDGMPDLTDNCPNDAGDNRGCPDIDKDKDGIVDSLDQCPWQPEDFDGFEDDDGCPEADNDRDGLQDAQDKCADVAEDIDGFEDADGCPDLDNDADGIPDTVDRCPNHKGVPEKDGCPAAKKIERGRLILSGVAFESGKDILTQNSYTILDQVVESLREWKEVKLEIQGYTDSQGSMAFNQRLSQKRAEAVRNYLIGQQVNPGRLRAVGYGEERPIADNATAKGRAKNRRVELHRID